MSRKVVGLWLMMVIGLGILFSVRVSASPLLEEVQLREFDQNGVLFYLPCGSSSDGGICGTNQNYAGAKVWTDAELKAIEANERFYQAAGEQYNIPWQIIAAIHKRESNLVRNNPSNGQGVYQFYSAAERAACAGGVFTPGKISDEQFQIQTNCMAKRLKEVYGKGLDLSKDNDIKRLFYNYNSGNNGSSAYNTQALRLGFTLEEARRGEGSPYVMNRYDAKREPSGSWGQIKTDGGRISYPANNDFGAFVYYKAITCGNGNSVACGSCERGNMNLNSTAACLAWPLDTEDSKTDYPGGSGSEVFNDAHKKVTPGSSDACAARGASCDMFVATVIRWAGYDKNYPLGNVMGQYAYVRSHPDLWEIIDWSGDQSMVQAGDVIWENGGGHTYIVMQDESGKNWIASASHCDYFGKIKKWRNPRLPAKIIRAKKAHNSVGGSGAAGCDACSGQTDGGLAQGGFQSVKEAEEVVMKEYKSLDNGTALSKYHITVGCGGVLINNCPSFVKYFVNKYTSKTWTGRTGNGSETAGVLAKKYKLPTGDQPRPYAVFSTKSGATMCGNTECGHTGVVLGVDTTNKKIIIGEAGCGSPTSWIGAHEYDLAEYMDGSYTYTYLDDILKSGGLAGE